MFLTNMMMKKAKSKMVMVMVQSAVSRHMRVQIRERLADKLEIICFDPFIREKCVYRETKKIRSLRSK